MSNRHPDVFDPAAYIADMRKAGIIIYPVGNGFGVFQDDGLGAEHDEVCFKWARARKAAPNAASRVGLLLKLEIAGLANCSRFVGDVDA